MNDIVGHFHADYQKVKDLLSRSIILSDDASSKDHGFMRDEYAALVLNRLIFTCFLQIPRKDLPSILPESYLRRLFAQFKDDFHHALCRLWFDYFNSSRPRNDLDGLFKVVPFLNCSLFSRHDPLERGADGSPSKITIRNEVWENVLLLLEKYTWTLSETDANESSPSINPSILGYIYEKACNQKESGSYYTPEYITEYIVRKCIGLLLTRKVNYAFKTSHDDVISGLLAKETSTPADLEQIIWLYFEVLVKLTVCDNACGSGAFLVAVERILEDLYRSCLTRVPSTHPGFQEHPECPRYADKPGEIKRHILTRNIFGVDIQPGSVEIARLRLWLRMISTLDIAQKEDLPYIDFNIRAGNSLLGFIRSNDAVKNKLLIRGDQVHQKIDSLKKYKENFKNARDSNEINHYKSLIEEGERQLREELDQAYFTSYGIASAMNKDLRLFHWCIEFEDVMERGGFDIIVGNPPYLSFSSSKANKTIIGKDIVRRLYKDVDDVYEAFIYRSRDLCSGIAGLIIPYNFYKQFGPGMARNLIDYDNLGEGIFIGVSIAVSIAFFDRGTHDCFKFRNYVFLENKKTLLGLLEPSCIVSFDLYKNDPLLNYIEKVARSHASYGIEVSRGEELGKKALSTERKLGFVPIYTANEMSQFRLHDARYFIDEKKITKQFYKHQKIGVNLAFRNRIKATFVSDVVTIKSIICIYNASMQQLLEVLGTWNSTLFDWYQDKKFSNFQEIRLNTIADIEKKYPLLLINRAEFQEIVKYLIVSLDAFLHRLIDYIVYENFLHEKFAEDNVYPKPGLHLLEAISKHIVPINYSEWADLHWKAMRGAMLNTIEAKRLNAIESEICATISNVSSALQSSIEVKHWIEAIQSHPWVARIEKETTQ